MSKILQNVFVVIPARNEEATIGRVVGEVLSLESGFRVVVVDDASDDKTAEEARLSGAEVLALPAHLGSWSAVQTGLRFAHKYRAEAVITMDGDGQHLADSLSALMKAWVETDVNVVVGAAPSRLSASRKLARHLIRIVSGLKIDDFTSGLRLYDAQALKILISRESSVLQYQDVGVLASLRSGHMIVSEVPVEMRGRLAGKSRVFYSWPRVLFYMTQTLILGMSKRKRSSRM